MKTVLVFGTFDILHPGHIWFLKNAATHGDKLIAVVSQDAFVMEWKGHPPVSNQKNRIATLKESKLVYDAIASDPCIRTYDVLRRVRPDVICLGHDQMALKKDMQEHLAIMRLPDWQPEIVILKPWKRQLYSSTLCNHKE